MKLELSGIRLSWPTYRILFAALSAVIILLATIFIFSLKEVSVKIDGKTSKLVTRAGTVATLLAEEEINISEHDRVSPSLNTPLFPDTEIIVRHAKPVVLDINGKTRKIYTVNRDVGSVIEGLGIDTSADIKVNPSADTRVSYGMIIHLKLLNRWVEKIRTDIPFETTRKDDSGLDKGKTAVATKGKPGVNEKVIEHVMAGGSEIETIVRSEKQIVDPVVQIVKVGTRIPRPAVAAAGGPGINISRGGRGVTMLATAYAPGTGGAGWRTATGTGVYKGIVAVDPRVIPLGTRLYIDGYGPAIAADTGGAIKGNRIDLGFSSGAEAIQFGRRSVVVHIQ